jgi:hypothetical protein
MGEKKHRIVVGGLLAGRLKTVHEYGPCLFATLFKGVDWPSKRIDKVETCCYLWY